MAKRISHIILSMLVLLSTIGIVVDKHYMGNHLMSVAFYQKAPSCCPMPTEHSEKNHGCRNEMSVQKIQDVFQRLDFHFDFIAPQAINSHDIFLQAWQLLCALMAEHHRAPENIFREAPPSPDGQALRLSIQSFIC
ncbi:HYC_CC_PP family protein [Persicobacter psychrovividus]|uniref:Uncharacterized protein n=1 Tax=Persicobacter psychrovividus TaxID=387638 RepID=A0ABN6LHE9_9BACT|nr:hypothetical protein PEPS_32420 [Persicobacter psychrovividus]